AESVVGRWYSKAYIGEISEWGSGKMARAASGSNHSAARFKGAFCAARQTTCGVAGMAISSWPSASVIALITAGGEAMAPASPQPLMPSGFDGQTVSIVSIVYDGTSSARGMQ